MSGKGKINYTEDGIYDHAHNNIIQEIVVILCGGFRKVKYYYDQTVWLALAKSCEVSYLYGQSPYYSWLKSPSPNFTQLTP